MYTMGFKGGDQFKAYMDKLTTSLAGGDLEVGFMEDATCGKNNDAHAASIAFINEMGAPNKNIPPRPFFRTAVQRFSPTWGKLIGVVMKNTKLHYSRTLHQVGQVIVGQIQQQIEETTQPPNADSTVRSKGFNKPLEDSKNMKRAVSYRIVK